MALAGLIGISFVQIFWPSQILHYICIYGVLILISAFTLYDVQVIIHNAKTKPKWDPVNESIDIYLDAIIMFESFLRIFMENEKKK